MQRTGHWQPDAVVSSPDDSVRISAAADGHIEVAVSGLDRHTDDTLARQVRAAARLALAALQNPEHTATGEQELPVTRARWPR